MSIFGIVVPLVVLSDSPELDEGGHKLTLIALGADESEAHHEDVVETALDDYPLLDLLQVEVDGKALDNLALLVFYIVVEGVFQCDVGDVLQAAVGDEGF